MLNEDRFRLVTLMAALFALCLLHPMLTHIFLIIIAPLVVSYFFTPYLAEFVFLVHRRNIPKLSTRIVRPRSDKFYYRFRLYSGIGLWKVIEVSLYSFLFFISIFFQFMPSPTFDYLFGSGSLAVIAVFPAIFLLTTVTVVLDHSGLRYVDPKEQYIERLGKWMGSKFRGFTGIVAVVLIAWKLLGSESILSGARELLIISAAMYAQIALTTVLYLFTVLRRDLGTFERILTEKYRMKPQRVEFELKLTPFSFSPDGR